MLSQRGLAAPASGKACAWGSAIVLPQRLMAYTVAALLLGSGIRETRGLDRPAEPAPATAPGDFEQSSELLVFLKPGTDVAQFARDHGLTIRKGLRSDPLAYVFDTGPARTATTAGARTSGRSRWPTAWLSTTSSGTRPARRWSRRRTPLRTR